MKPDKTPRRLTKPHPKGGRPKKSEALPKKPRRRKVDRAKLLQEISKDERLNDTIARLEKLRSRAISPDSIGTEQRRAMVAYMKLEGVSMNSAARTLGVSRKTIQTDEAMIARMWGEVVVDWGWEAAIGDWFFSMKRLREMVMGPKTHRVTRTTVKADGSEERTTEERTEPGDAGEAARITQVMLETMVKFKLVKPPEGIAVDDWERTLLAVIVDKSSLRPYPARVQAALDSGEIGKPKEIESNG